MLLNFKQPPLIYGYSTSKKSYLHWEGQIKCCHTLLHLGFSAKLKIQQVLTCKMEPQSGIIFCLNRPAGRPATRPPQCLRSCISAFTDKILTKLIGRFARPSATAENCNGAICPCNIGPCHNSFGPTFSGPLFFFSNQNLFWTQNYFQI